MPIYAYRCRDCGGVTEQLAAVEQHDAPVACEHCQSPDTYRIIGRTAYHANEATKTAKLDPKYERMVDSAMRKSASADPARLLKRMKPFKETGKKTKD